MPRGLRILLGDHLLWLPGLVTLAHNALGSVGVWRCVRACCALALAVALMLLAHCVSGALPFGPGGATGPSGFFLCNTMHLELSMHEDAPVVTAMLAVHGLCFSTGVETFR